MSRGFKRLNWLHLHLDLYWYEFFYKRLAYLFSLDYGNVIVCLTCHRSFSLLQPTIACLQGARSHRGCPANCGALDLFLAEGQVCDHVYLVHV